MTDINIPQGNDKSWEVTITDQDDAVVDISTAEIYFYIKTDLNDADADALVERGNTAAGGGNTEISFTTDGSDGKFQVHLVPANTATLEGRYAWKVEIVLSSKTYTPDDCYGTIYIVGVE